DGVLAITRRIWSRTLKQGTTSQTPAPSRVRPATERSLGNFGATVMRSGSGLRPANMTRSGAPSLRPDRGPVTSHAFCRERPVANRDPHAADRTARGAVPAADGR